MKLPYKYRGAVLLASLTVVLPWAAWRFALGETFGTWRGCRRLCVQLAAMAPAPAPGERVAAVVQGSELVFSGLLLDTVRQAADSVGVQVTGYEPLVTLARDGLAVHTAQLTLAGGYAPLLRVVGELERTLPRCRLRSLGWQSSADRRTRCLQLTLTLYIQQVVLKK